MLTIIAGSMLFIASSYIGMQVKRHYAKRKQYIADLLEFIEHYENQISYLKTPLNEIIAKYCDNKKGEIVKMLHRLIEYLNNKKLGEETLQSSLLSRGENQAIMSYFLAIGASNMANELNKIKSIKGVIISMLGKSREQYNKNGLLAYKLGVLIGIALMLIVV